MNWRVMMKKVEVVMANIFAIVLVLFLSEFKAATLKKQIEYWLDSKYLNFRSYMHTIR
jgi:predicted transglutaminase-like protease